MDHTDFSQKYDEARRLFGEEQYDASLRLLDELNRVTPNHKDILFARAQCLAKCGKTSEAKMICEHLSSALGDPRGDELKEELGRDLFPEWEVGGIETEASASVEAPDATKQGAVRRFLHAAGGAVTAIFFFWRKAKQASLDDAAAGSESAGDSAATAATSETPSAGTTGDAVSASDVGTPRGGSLAAGEGGTSAGAARGAGKPFFLFAWLAWLFWFLARPFIWLFGTKVAFAAVPVIVGAAVVSTLYVHHVRATAPLALAFAPDSGLGTLGIYPAIPDGYGPWQSVGYARGALEVPKNARVTLYSPGVRLASPHVAPLSQLRGLVSLNLNRAVVDTQTLSFLNATPLIERLDLSWSNIGDEGLALLAGLTSLRSLNLMNTNVGDDGLVHLEALTALEQLNLSKNRWNRQGQGEVTGNGLGHLAPLAGLKKLGLEGVKAEAGELCVLTGLTTLQELDLQRASLNAESLACLEKMPWLKKLNLSGAEIEAQGEDVEQRLKEALATTEIDCRGTRYYMILRFPEDRSFGVLARQNARGFDWRGTREYTMLRSPEDRNFGVVGGQEVKGEVRRFYELLTLGVGADEIHDLSPLGDLPPNGLHHLVIENATIPTEQLPCVGTLSGLREMTISNCSFVGEGGLQSLGGLVGLTHLFMPNVTLGEEGLKGIGSISNLACLIVSGARLTEKDMKELASLVNLRILEIEKAPVSIQSLAMIGGFTNLRRLGLEGAQFEPDATEGLANLVNLTDLNLRDASITDAALEGLGALKELRKLDLKSTHATGKALAGLASLSGLTHLNLSSLPIRDEDLIHLAGLENLIELDLGHTAITGEGLAHLRNLGKLQRLSLEFLPNFDGRHLAHLAALPSLESLTLRGSGVKDEHTKHLAALSNLSGWLNLSENPITDVSLVHLAGLQKLRFLYLGRTQVTGPGLQHLENMGRLRELYLAGAPVTDETVAQLRAALPNCDIKHSFRMPDGDIQHASQPPTDTQDEQAPPVEERQPGTEQSFAGIEFVWIPPGTFMMGLDLSPAEAEASFHGEAYYYSDNWKPRHKVTFAKGFWMSKCEITNAQFRMFRAEHDSGDHKGHTLNDNEQPVSSVSWQDAEVFCDWMSAQNGGRYGLPTEAQWEYACSAGTDGVQFWGEGDAETGRYANIFDEFAAKTLYPSGKVYGEDPVEIRTDDGFAVAAPVGSLNPNAFGLHDMVGNVSEWCADWYLDTYYAQSSENDPKGPETGSKKVFRGGSWLHAERGVLQLQRRMAAPPEHKSFELGFRVVHTVESEQAPPAEEPESSASVVQLPGMGPGARTIVFPEDALLGIIRIRDWGSTDVTAWKKLGNARGTVQIPAGKEVQLSLRLADLSPFADLNPNDIQELEAGNMKVGDEDLKHLVGLTGLRELRLPERTITEEAVERLRKVLPECRIERQ